MNTMNKNGFTLMELIVATSLGLVVMFAMYSLSEMGQRSSVSISQKVVTQQDTRAVLGLMAMEIRMASYNPSISTTIWNSSVPTNCATVKSVIGAVVTNQLKKGIQFASGNAILVAMDLGPLGPPPVYGTIGDANNEYILYNYDVNAGKITRNVSCGNNETILGGAGSATMIANNATNPAVNLFTYRGPDIDHPDASGNCADIDITAKVSSTDAATAAKWIPQIRSVVITIVADTELADKTTKQKRRMTYSTSVIVRNHVLSPPIPNT